MLLPLSLLLLLLLLLLLTINPAEMFLQTLSYLLPLLSRLQPWNSKYRSKSPKVRDPAYSEGWWGYASRALTGPLSSGVRVRLLDNWRGKSCRIAQAASNSGQSQTGRLLPQLLGGGHMISA
jgi:hypothetical protein